MKELEHILKTASRTSSLPSARLLPLVYDELRNVARKMMSVGKGQNTVRSTALVHKAWIKLGA